MRLVQIPLNLSPSSGKTSPSNFPGLFKVDPQVVMPLTPVMNSDLGWGEKETWLSEELLQVIPEELCILVISACILHFILIIKYMV